MTRRLLASSHPRPNTEIYSASEVLLRIILTERDREIAGPGWCVDADGLGGRQRAMETAQHWARLARNQPSEIAMFQISEVQESPAFNGRLSFLTLRGRSCDDFLQTMSEVVERPEWHIREHRTSEELQQMNPHAAKALSHTYLHSTGPYNTKRALIPIPSYYSRHSVHSLTLVTQNGTMQDLAVFLAAVGQPDDSYNCPKFDDHEIWIYRLSDGEARFNACVISIPNGETKIIVPGPGVEVFHY